MYFDPQAVSRKRCYTPPEAAECAICLHTMLAESEMIDPGVEDQWGEV